ncbi:unnamed protein product [Staurois parvus]|uniref:Uncharacterized protein n=1 Tax=Staurois parvus TaxID=386267 RepID=A0ABN9CH47_9NEOB|nr:unnamed protein product [Staurois parvus]
MICVSPAAPPVSVHQCQLSVLIHATCQCPSELPFSVIYQCPSVMPVNAHQCHLPVPPHQCPSLQPH